MVCVALVAAAGAAAAHEDILLAAFSSVGGVVKWGLPCGSAHKGGVCARPAVCGRLVLCLCCPPTISASLMRACGTCVGSLEACGKLAFSV